MMLQHMLRHAALHAIDVCIRDQRASALYIQRIAHETSWERGCAMLAHPISLEKRDVSFREIVDERTEIPVQAMRSILCTVQTRRPRWNTGAVFVPGIAQRGFGTNATSALGCPSLSFTGGTQAFVACPSGCTVSASGVKCATGHVA